MEYTSNDIKNLNSTNLWNNQIIQYKEFDSKKLKLYPTNNISITNGRTYVALPKNLELTDKNIKKFDIFT